MLKKIQLVFKNCWFSHEKTNQRVINQLWRICCKNFITHHAKKSAIRYTVKRKAKYRNNKKNFNKIILEWHEEIYTNTNKTYKTRLHVSNIE